MKDLTTAPGMERVRVADLRPNDVLVGSSRTVVTSPSRAPRRRHVQLVVRDPNGTDKLVTWRSDTRIFVRRPIDTPAPRRDTDG